MRIHWWNDCDPAWPIWQLTVQSTISILSWIGDFTATIISYSASTITHLASCNVGQKLRTTSNRRYCLLPSALRTAVSLSPTSPVASDCARHIVASWTCHVINAVHSAVVHFLSPNWETTWKTVVLGSHWKHCFSVSTSVPSALEVYLYTTMRYVNRRFTYLLTY